MHDSTEVRLARIEDSLANISKKLDERHRELEKILTPLQREHHSHNVSIAILKRDRWWIMSIAGMVGSTMAIVLERWKS